MNLGTPLSSRGSANCQVLGVLRHYPGDGATRNPGEEEDSRVVEIVVAEFELDMPEGPFVSHLAQGVAGGHRRLQFGSQLQQRGQGFVRPCLGPSGGRNALPRAMASAFLFHCSSKSEACSTSPSVPKRWTTERLIEKPGFKFIVIEAGPQADLDDAFHSDLR
jgi:hypothetical protein